MTTEQQSHPAHRLAAGLLVVVIDGLRSDLSTRVLALDVLREVARLLAEEDLALAGLLDSAVELAGSRGATT